MRNRSKVAVTILLLLAVAGLAGLDAYWNQRQLTAYLPGGTLSERTPSSGVPLPQGPDVKAVIEAEGFMSAETSEQSLLRQVLQEQAPVSDLSILQEEDRVGSVTWVRSAEVKKVFIALKEALLPAFSPQVRGLQDATETPTGRPVRNVLRFTDPGLGEDGFTFVRVGSALYEFHIVAGKEAEMQKVIDALTNH